MWSLVERSGLGAIAVDLKSRLVEKGSGEEVEGNRGGQSSPSSTPTRRVDVFSLLPSAWSAFRLAVSSSKNFPSKRQPACTVGLFSAAFPRPNLALQEQPAGAFDRCLCSPRTSPIKLFDRRTSCATKSLVRRFEDWVATIATPFFPTLLSPPLFIPEPAPASVRLTICAHWWKRCWAGLFRIGLRRKKVRGDGSPSMDLGLPPRGAALPQQCALSYAPPRRTAFLASTPSRALLGLSPFSAPHSRWCRLLVTTTRLLSSIALHHPSSASTPRSRRARVFPSISLQDPT